MADEISQRAYHLFLRALELPKPEREPFIASNTESRPEALAAARRILHSYEQEEDIEIGEAVKLPDWAQERKGSVVAGWQIDGDLEMGGFGRVYRAWRPIPGGKEEAAIKFLDMAPGEIPRFLRERQILADLNHEGICKFVDGGTTPGGVPFIVMEYVAGIPITQHCASRHLSLTERLHLFLKLCAAVEYAHRQRVLHRDLKPANILVTAGGAVRVLDFGLAKIIEPGSRKRLTRTGQQLWTKTYASPEQVNGGDLTMATDVYALGVVLYELVTGQLPLSEFALSGSDWMRVLEERDPLPPSHALLIEQPSDISVSRRPIETAATSRRESSSQLKKALRGDLDAIILQALRKDPRQRYLRVDRLRADIQRFLDGRSVTVRRCRWWERVQKWSARHRVSASVIAASMLCVVFQFQRAALRAYDATAQVFYERDAIRRVQFLAEVGFPKIEGAMPTGPQSFDTRLAIARIHSRLLQRIEAFPDYILMDLDSNLASSALQCAREWQNLGSASTALEVIAPVLLRIETRYRQESRDRPWAELYSQLLRQQIELASIAGQGDEATAAMRRLVEVERRRRH